MKDAEVIEAMARAIAGAEFGYSFKLTRLVDGVSTYELKFSDSDEVHQFEDTEEAYELIAERKRMTQARAAFAIFPTPHDGLTDTSHHAGSSAGELDWRRIAKAAGTHGVRYRTNSALEAFLREIAASPAAVGVPREVSKAWPNGCPKTRSCSRNKGCMYGCAAHKDRDGATLRSEIEAAIAAASPAPPHQGGKSE